MPSDGILGYIAADFIIEISIPAWNNQGCVFHFIEINRYFYLDLFPPTDPQMASRIWVC